MDRRTFLSLSAAATAGLLTGCGTQNQLAITLLQGSIPPQIVGDFKKKLAEKKALVIKPEEQLAKIVESLQAWHDPEASKGSWWDDIPLVGQSQSPPANLVTLGDAWLESAIAENLIQPLDTNKLATWPKLAPKWQQFVRRDSQGKLDPHGQVYGAPYRFGSLVIVYDQDRFSGEITDWSDLWRPDLQGRISLLDDYRTAIGLTLKKLGYSFNTEDLSSVADLEPELQQLQQQVRLYSSDKYLQPLVLGDTWVAVGWSSDVLAISDRYSKLKIVVPTSGTSLWADLWVKPQTKASQAPGQEQATPSTDNPLVNQWLDFCWQPKSAKQILLFADGISPIAIGNSDLAKDLATNPLAQAMISNFEQQEFITSLAPETNAQYLEAWQKMRNISNS